MSKIDPITQYILEKENLNEGGYKTLLGMTFLSGGLILVGPLNWAIYRSIRGWVDDKSRQCGILNIGRERDVCLWKLRALEAKKFVPLLNKIKKDCKKAKSPEKCIAKIEKKKQKMLDKHKMYMDKIRTYANKNPQKARKAKSGLAKAADPSAKWV